jgi:hypothetical protein
MNAPLRLGGRNPLHAMGAAFVLQARVDAVAADEGDDLLDASGIGLGKAQISTFQPLPSA